MKNKPEISKLTGQLNFTKVLLDRSGTFLISSCSDKSFSIQDMLAGTLVTKGSFGEAITSLQLSLDNKYLITTSVEGSIYFWRLSDQITKAISQRLNSLNVIVPTLAEPNLRSLKMPPLRVKSTAFKPPSQAIKAKESEDWDDSWGKLPFAGKNPGEILFKKNKERDYGKPLNQDFQEKAKPPNSLTESQFVRHEEAKEVNDMVGNIADNICNMFETSNQNKIVEDKNLEPKENWEISYK